MNTAAMWEKDYHTQKKRADDATARVRQLEEELKEAEQHHEDVIGLLRKRFPKRPDGTYPDWAIEDVLKENEVLTLANELAEHLKQQAESQRDELVRVVEQIVEVWDRQCGRVFESMGNDNPRAQAIDEAVSHASKVLKGIKK